MGAWSQGNSTLIITTGISSTTPNASWVKTASSCPDRPTGGSHTHTYTPAHTHSHTHTLARFGPIYLDFSPRYVMFSGWVGDDDPTLKGMESALKSYLQSAWAGGRGSATFVFWNDCLVVHTHTHTHTLTHARTLTHSHTHAHTHSHTHRLHKLWL